MNSQQLAQTENLPSACADAGVFLTPSPALDQMLGIADMRRVLNLGNTAIYEGVKTGAIPAPYRIFGRRVAWKAREVQAFLDALPRASVVEGDAR